MRRESLRDRLWSQRGQGITEYGIVLTVAIACAVVAVALLHG
jgi:hypothetical protein